MVEPGTGEVRALSQSRPMGADRAKGQTYLNYVVPTEYGDANGFQAGSTFKAFVLAAAIKQGIPLSTHDLLAADRCSIQPSELKTCDGTLGERRHLVAVELHRHAARTTSTPAPSSR